MALQAMYDTQEEIPEAFRELFTEKGEKWELTGVTGIKTQGDIDRLQTALVKERDDHKATKGRLEVWGELDPEDTKAKLEKYPELEAAAEGKIDEKKMDEMVNRRVEATVKSQTAALQRQIDSLTTERDEVKAENVGLLGEKRTRVIHDNVRDVLTKQKVIPEAFEDALMLADRVFEIREDDNSVITRDQVGVTPGVTADIWLSEMQDRRPHWWPTSAGGGGRGTGTGPGTGFKNNPFSREHWNMTEQGRVVREDGMEKAQQMAKSAGTTVGGQMPQAKA